MDPAYPTLHELLLSNKSTIIYVENGEDPHEMTVTEQMSFDILEDERICEVSGMKSLQEDEKHGGSDNEYMLLDCSEGENKMHDTSSVKLFDSQEVTNVKCMKLGSEEMQLENSVSVYDKDNTTQNELNSLQYSEDVGGRNKAIDVNPMSLQHMRDKNYEPDDSEDIPSDNAENKKKKGRVSITKKGILCSTQIRKKLNEPKSPKETWIENSGNKNVKECTYVKQAFHCCENSREKLVVNNKVSECSKGKKLDNENSYRERSPFDCLGNENIGNKSTDVEQLSSECSKDGGRSTVTAIVKKMPSENLELIDTISKQEQLQFSDTIRKDDKCLKCGKKIGKLNSSGLENDLENLKDSDKCSCCLQEMVGVNRNNSLIQMGRKFHAIINSGEKPFKCYQCKEDFRYMADLKQHLIHHTREKPFQCDVCGKTFRFESMMKRHMIFHSDEKPFKCTLCGKVFKIVGHLNQHMVVHYGRKPVECSICGEEFKQRRFLKQHMVIHNEEKPFSCSLCEKYFKYNCDLKEHMFTHLGDNPFKCSVCGKEFNRKSNLRQHKVTHLREKQYKCPVCGKAFTLNGNLKQHMAATHIVEKIFKCIECGKEFNRKSNYDQHKAVHSSETPFKCLLCEKVFKLKGHLRKHMFTHTEDKAFQCLGCRKEFRFKSDLKRHMNSGVIGDKALECSECGKKMRCKGELKQHMFSHTGEKYECSECGKQYTQRGTLNRHRLSHVEEKSYECSKCGKEFNRKSDLDQHMFSHIEEGFLKDFHYHGNKSLIKNKTPYNKESSSMNIAKDKDYNFMKHMITIKTEAESDSHYTNSILEAAEDSDICASAINGASDVNDEVNGDSEVCDDNECLKLQKSIEFVNNRGGTEIFIKEEVDQG
ncbi:LOW QUALITY PROTEIN: uncharacterized protein [Panulirus ornatus]|uniref:LOW QUALITY PROTEIN: uncharacterized protein n=1 Tax=Panulirus ornatus TaxID=150431 RepID=UPI003A849320